MLDRHFRVIPTIAAICVALTACNDPTTGHADDQDQRLVKDQRQAPATAKPSTKLDRAEYYKGYIDDKFEFFMYVVPYENKKCSGNYYYKKYKRPIPLAGECDANKVTLNELTADGYTSVTPGPNRFIGVRSGNQFSGTWHSGNGVKAYDFTSLKVIPNKREILEDFRGEYLLVSMGGLSGANTLLDIYKRNGAWKASGSAISGGMRSGFSLDLNGRAKKILSTLKLVVDEELAVSIYSEDRRVAKFPYQENGGFKIKNIQRQGNDLLQGDRFQIFERSEYGNFHEGRLLLTTSDEFNFSELINFGVFAVEEEHAVAVDFVLGGFDVRILNANCCDNVGLRFERRH
ncbi:MAG: hypothetical protein ACKVQK_02520 [Burkholderiales bacterium]